MHVDRAFQHNGIVTQGGVDQFSSTEDASFVEDENLE